MIGSFSNLARIWRIARTLELAEASSEWTHDDAVALASFLRGDTGTKLIATLRQLTFVNAHAAVMAEPDRLHWTCGHAAGMQTICGQIDLLARLNGEPDKKRSGPTDDLNWLHGNTDTSNG